MVLFILFVLHYGYTTRNCGGYFVNLNLQTIRNLQMSLK